MKQRLMIDILISIIIICLYIIMIGILEHEHSDEDKSQSIGGLDMIEPIPIITDDMFYCGVSRAVDKEIVVDMNDYNIIEVNEKEYEELARIIMAEADGEDLDGKILVGNVIMNRVNSDEFPNDIISVVRQENNGTYQFSPVASGRIDVIAPSDECYKAVDIILSGYDISEGALYFESCTGESWHSRNLEFLFKHGGHRFYK